MRTLPEELADRARQQTDRIAIRFEGEPITFGELWERSRRAASGLSGLGLGPGDRFALFLSNSPEFAEIWLGGMLIGATAVPINLAYQGEFLRHQLDDSGARAIVADAGTLDAVAAVLGDCEAIECVIVQGGDDSWSALPEGVRAISTQALVANPPADLDSHPTPAPGSPATILYTSGTTGRSKGVVLSHEYLVRLGQTFVDCADLTTADVVFIPMPMFHLSGLQGLLTPILAGSQSVVEKRFSPNTAWEIVRRHGCTGMVSVGPMISMLMALPPEPSDAQLPLRFIGTAPLPCPVDEIRQRYGVEVQTMYGLTEAFPIAIVPLGEKFPEGSAGRLVNDDLDVRFLDEEGRDVPVGEPGEIVVRAKVPHAIFEGYLQGEGKAADRVAREEWFRTGDIGRVDDDGYFYFVDRKKDAIRRRGENISSVELETAIRRHPAVEDVAVHGVPSDLGEEEVKAVIVPTADGGESADSLFDFFDQALPRFARPRYLEFVSSLPRNPVGRIQKFVLRDRGITDTTIERPT